jgi:hypothetical protein
MRSNLRRRLERLVRSRPPAPRLYIACVDANGLILDSGTPVCRPWVGRHYSELPAGLQTLHGVAPWEIVGMANSEGHHAE